MISLGITGLLLSLGLLVIFMRGAGGNSFLTSYWALIVLLVFVAMFLVFISYRFRIVVTPEAISYRGATKRERKMRFQDMKSYRIEIGMLNEGGFNRNVPFYRLILTDGRSEEVIINFKLMKLDEFRLLVKILEKNGIIEKKQH